MHTSANQFCRRRQKEDVEWNGNSRHCRQAPNVHAEQYSPWPVQLCLHSAWSKIQQSINVISIMVSKNA